MENVIKYKLEVKFASGVEFEYIDQNGALIFSENYVSPQMELNGSGLSYVNFDLDTSIVEFAVVGNNFFQEFQDFCTKIAKQLNNLDTIIEISLSDYDLNETYFYVNQENINRIRIDTANNAYGTNALTTRLFIYKGE